MRTPPASHTRSCALAANAWTACCWDNALDSNAIEVHVHHLRRKLGDGVIRTLRGVGYFVPENLPGDRP